MISWKVEKKRTSTPPSVHDICDSVILYRNSLKDEIKVLDNASVLMRCNIAFMINST